MYLVLKKIVLGGRVICLSKMTENILKNHMLIKTHGIGQSQLMRFVNVVQKFFLKMIIWELVNVLTVNSGTICLAKKLKILISGKMIRMMNIKLKEKKGSIRL